VEWRSGVACARSDRFEGGARLVGAGTAPRRRCMGAAWRPGRRGRRAARGSGRGVGLGRRSAAGQGETRGRRGREPGRLRPWVESEAAAREGEKPFVIYIFKKLLNASFQILF